jgi:hypothetical protein
MAGSSRRQHLVELFSTILLAFAALGTAWSTYQSTQLHRERQREALLVLGWLIFLAGTIWPGTSPVQLSV